MRWLSLILSAPLIAASVTTGHNDLARTGANASETVITASNVGQIHLTCAHTVDDYVWGQPLVATYTTGGATHVLVASTANNTVYAWNADTCAAALWTRSLGTAVTMTDGAYGPRLGCFTTPEIDESAGLVSLVCLNTTGWQVFSLKLADGTDNHSPVTVSGTSNGRTFSTAQQQTRTAMLRVGGNLYFGFASYGDGVPYQGWIFAYDATTLAQVAVRALVNTANGAAGVWQSAGGMSSDGTSVFAVSGNGTCPGDNINYGQSIIKLNSSLSVLDYISPSNCSTLNASDLDLSARPLLFAGNVMTGDKDGTVYVVSQTSMGGVEGSGGTYVQKFSAPSNGILSGTLYANSNLYLGRADVRRYAWSGTAFATSPNATGSGRCFGSMSYTPGVVWCNSTKSTDAWYGSTPKVGMLRAVDATTLVELWNSETVAGDNLGNWSKFAAPTIVNGKVYVPTFSSKVLVYGLTYNTLTNSKLSGNSVIK